MRGRGSCALAYAFSFVANVPPLVSLQAAWIMCFVTALFNGCPGVISGAAGSIAVLLPTFMSVQEEQKYQPFLEFVPEARLGPHGTVGAPYSDTEKILQARQLAKQAQLIKLFIYHNANASGSGIKVELVMLALHFCKICIAGATKVVAAVTFVMQKGTFSRGLRMRKRSGKVYLSCWAAFGSSSVIHILASQISRPRHITLRLISSRSCAAA